MTNKEKVKAYDEALKKASAAYKDEDKHLKATLERIFPELKESEDEMIKTAILNHLKKMWGNCQDDVCGVHVEDAIAWLERQGKHTKQVHYSKFTFDDVLALQCCMETVKKVQEDKELYEKLNLIHSKMYDAYSSNTEKINKKPTDKIKPKFKVGDWVVRGDTIAQILDIQEQYYIGLDIKDDKIHLWTIQDAKDDNVLVNGSNIFIFHDINNKRLMG